MGAAKCVDRLYLCKNRERTPVFNTPQIDNTAYDGMPGERVAEACDSARQRHGKFYQGVGQQRGADSIS